MPTPLSGAPTMPATKVPWPPASSSGGSSHERSGSSSHGPSMTGSSRVKFRLSAASKFGAMSGCAPSMPVSRIPTSTSGLPCSTRWEPAASAWIMPMFHCTVEKGSAAASAGVAGAAELAAPALRTRSRKSGLGR